MATINLYPYTMHYSAEKSITEIYFEGHVVATFKDTETGAAMQYMHDMNEAHREKYALPMYYRSIDALYLLAMDIARMRRQL